MPAKRVRLQPAERRPLLLDAAEQVFGRLGYDATRIEDVAKEAGVAKGLLYQHFESKEELFSVVMAYKAEQFTTRLVERFAETFDESNGDPWALVATGLALWTQQVADDIAEQRWLTAPTAESAYQPFRDATRAVLVSQIKVFAPEVDETTASYIAAAFDGAIEALSMAWAAAGADPRTQRDALELLVAFCLRGLDGVREYLAVDLPPAPPIQPRKTSSRRVSPARPARPSAR